MEDRPPKRLLQWSADGTWERLLQQVQAAADAEGAIDWDISVDRTSAPSATGLYGASKFALEGTSEALHGELAPLGLRVTILEPGGFRTDLLGSSSLRTEPPRSPTTPRARGRCARRWPATTATSRATR